MLGCVLCILDYLQGWRFHNLSMQHSNCVFLLYLIRISLVSADFHPLLCISEDSSLHLPVRYLQTAVRPVQSSLFMLDRLSSLSLSLCVMLQPLLQPLLLLCLCAAGFTPVHSDFVLWKPQLETILDLQSHNCWIEGALFLICCAFANTAQFTIDLCQVSILLALVQLDVYENLQVLFCKAGFLPASISLSWCVGLVCSGLCTELLEVSVNLLRSFLIASLPSVHFWWHWLSWSWPPYPVLQLPKHPEKP